MPVTAKLSRLFQDRFGDDIASELVEWFNKVDENYRNGLRELNEANFARFDARLEQRLAEQGSAIRGEIATLGERLGTQIASLEIRTARETMHQTRWMVALWAAQITIFTGAVLVVMIGP